MRDKRRKFLCYGSSSTGEFFCSLLIKDSGLTIEEGETIQYEEPIPDYHLNKYDPNAKGGISSITLIPIVAPEFITINFTISPTNEI